MATPIWEIQQSLNVLAYGAFPPADGLGARDSQLAANDYAGTTGLELQFALNCKYQGVTTPQEFYGGGYQMYEAQYVSNLLASIDPPTAEIQNALSKLAGGGYDA